MATIQGQLLFLSPSQDYGRVCNFCMSVHNNAVKVKTNMKMNTKMEIKLKIKPR